MIPAGRRDQRVLLQSRVGRDAAGQPIEAWGDVVPDGDGRIWAEVRDISGREFVSAGATQNEVLTTITILYRAGIGPAMRVVHGVDIYNIVAVLRSRDRRTLQLMCSKGLP